MTTNTLKHRPAPGRQHQRGAVNNRLPFWLVMLGLALMLGAFSRNDDAGGRRRVDNLPFDLDSLPATGSGPDASNRVRRSNQAFALEQTDGGRFYALYGPPAVTGAASDRLPPLAGVLIGELPAGDRPAPAVTLHEFSLESGALRVATQDGPFTPRRFLKDDATDGVDAASAPILSRPNAPHGSYAGRLADAGGSATARVQLGADGALSIAAAGCRVQGRLMRSRSASLWPVEAVYGADCAQVGEPLRGHAIVRGEALYILLPDADLNGGAVFEGRRS